MQCLFKNKKSSFKSESSYASFLQLGELVVIDTVDPLPNTSTGIDSLLQLSISFQKWNVIRPFFTNQRIMPWIFFVK